MLLGEYTKDEKGGGIMKIRKILNNNSAVVLDDDGQEVVVIGKAIAFKKKVGEAINPAIIEKKFCLSSQNLNTKFQDVIVNLPLEEISVVTKIITEIRMHIGKKISESIYVSLSDHIHYALKNYERGIHVTNNLMYDIQRFYPDEYKLGLAGLDIIEENTGIRLSIDEAGFIALHIVNAETENGMCANMVEKSTKIIAEILDIVTNYFEQEITEGTLVYFRFINHLRYFAYRIVNQSMFLDEKKDKDLLDMMKVTYQKSYMCAVNIQEFIRAKYNIEIGNEELLYLIIHIQRAMLNN